MAWKVLVFYFLATSLNGFYDLGVYLHFYIHGPKAMRACLDLPKEECFSPIQVNLFMRHAADNEILKAMGDKNKRKLTELVCVRSVNNQLRD